MHTARLLAYYLFPRHSNNHRAKLIHTPNIFLISVFLVVYQLGLNFLFPSNVVKTLGYAANISADEIIRLTNEKRAQSGLGALRYNPNLTQAAQAKARHMIDNDYWAHVAPDGTEPWKFFTDAGYRYRYAGENLARDFSNPSAVVEAWMASPSHRDNLMSTKYIDIGIGITEGDLSGADTTIVVQLFGTPISGETAPAPAQAKVPATATPDPTRLHQPTAAPTFTITPIPTPIPTEIIPSPQPTTSEGGVILTTLPPAEKEASKFNILIAPFQTTRGVSLVVTGVLLMVFIIDAIVVFRRRLNRNHGRTLAHLSFLGAILAIVLIARAGQIL